MNSISGKIIAISISDKKGIPKSNINSAKLLVDYGIENDAHAGNWHRQVSLLAEESINAMKKSGLNNLHPGIFAENITTNGIIIKNLKPGNKLKIGTEVLLEITQIGKECHSRCAIFYTAGDCVMPREGVFAKVINGGIINLNDGIKILK